MTRAILIQPPFVQLNAPYPAIHYLAAFLRKKGVEPTVADLSIETTRELFSAKGLAKVFTDARESLSRKRHPDRATASRIEDYLAQEERYVHTIDALCDFLSGGDPAFAYRLATGAGIPSGMRSEAFLEVEGGIGPDNARGYATAIINDLSDFIRYALDPGFGTVRYAERVATSCPDYTLASEAAESSYVLSSFYLPLLERLFAQEAGKHDKVITCLSLPFPGCLAGTILAARFAKRTLGERTLVAVGGGYVSTELRFLDDPAPFADIDYFCYDAGYGALSSLLDIAEDKKVAPFRARYLDDGGKVVASGFPLSESRGPAFISCPKAATYESEEEKTIVSIAPDYRDVDFRRYLRVVDAPNLMHRLWNDTPWLKYRLAYGCYWHKCSFCDTELDYVSRNLSSDIDALVASASEAAERSGLYGIHFVDEAMPMRALKEFARINEARERPFTFWGNIRFDASWTKENASYLAERGLVAVCGGIESATERGLKMAGKGLNLEALIRTLASIKESGILTHAYLMYGLPSQDGQDIADSAETVRALLEEGLLDSAFWHRFVLTRHSRMYAEWERGERHGLDPVAPTSRFAFNDLSFKGEGVFDAWSTVLDSACEAWVHRGETDSPLTSIAPGFLPKPSIDTAYIILKALHKS